MANNNNNDENSNNNEKSNNNIQELREIAGVLKIEVTSKEFMAIAVDYIQKKALGIIPDPDADAQGPAPIKAADMRSPEVQKGYTEDLDAVFKAFSFSTHTKPDKFKKEYTEPENLKSIAEKYEADDKLFSDQYTAQKNARTPGLYYKKQQEEAEVELANQHKLSRVEEERKLAKQHEYGEGYTDQLNADIDKERASLAKAKEKQQGKNDLIEMFTNELIKKVKKTNDEAKNNINDLEALLEAVKKPHKQHEENELNELAATADLLAAEVANEGQKKSKEERLNLAKKSRVAKNAFDDATAANDNLIAINEMLDKDRGIVSELTTADLKEDKLEARIAEEKAKHRDPDKITAANIKGTGKSAQGMLTAEDALSVKAVFEYNTPQGSTTTTKGSVIVKDPAAWALILENNPEFAEELKKQRISELIPHLGVTEEEAKSEGYVTNIGALLVSIHQDKLKEEENGTTIKKTERLKLLQNLQNHEKAVNNFLDASEEGNDDDFLKRYLLISDIAAAAGQDQKGSIYALLNSKPTTDILAKIVNKTNPNIGLGNITNSVLIEAFRGEDNEDMAPNDVHVKVAKALDSYQKVSIKISTENLNEGVNHEEYNALNDAEKRAFEVKKIVKDFYHEGRDDENLTEEEILILPPWLQTAIKESPKKSKEDIKTGLIENGKPTPAEAVQRAELYGKLLGNTRDVGHVGPSYAVELLNGLYPKGSDERNKFNDALRLDSTDINTNYFTKDGHTYYKLHADNVQTWAKIPLFDTDLAKGYSSTIYNQYRESNNNPEENKKLLSVLIGRVVDPNGWNSLLESMENPNIKGLSEDSGVEPKKVSIIIKKLITEPDASQWNDPIELNDYLKIQQVLEKRKDSSLYKSTYPGFDSIKKNIDTMPFSLEFSNEMANEKERGAESANGKTFRNEGHLFESINKSISEQGNKTTEDLNNAKKTEYDALSSGKRTFSGSETGIGKQLIHHMSQALISDTEDEYTEGKDIVPIINGIPQGILLKAKFAIDQLTSGTERDEEGSPVAVDKIGKITEVLRLYKGPDDKPALDEGTMRHIANSGLISLSSNMTNLHYEQAKINGVKLSEAAKGVSCPSCAVNEKEFTDAVNNLAEKNLADLSPDDLNVLSVPSIMNYLKEKDDEGESALTFFERGEDTRAFMNKLAAIDSASRDLDSRKYGIGKNPVEAKNDEMKTSEAVDRDNERRNKYRNELENEDEAFKDSEKGVWKNKEVEGLDPHQQKKYQKISNKFRSSGETSITALNNHFWKPSSGGFAGFLQGGFGVLKAAVSSSFQTAMNGETNSILADKVAGIAKDQSLKVVGNATNNFQNTTLLNKSLGQLVDFKGKFQPRHDEITKTQKGTIASYAEMYDDIMKRKEAAGAIPTVGNEVDFSNLDSAYPPNYSDEVVNDFTAGKRSPSMYLEEAIDSYGSWGTGTLGLGNLTSESKEYMDSMKKKNEDDNRERRRSLLASSVSLIAPSDKDSVATKPVDKIIDNILDAANEKTGCLEPKDLRGIIKTLMPGEDVEHLSFPEAIKKLKSVKDQHSRISEKYTRTVDVLRDNSSTKSNVTIMVGATGEFAVSGAIDKNDIKSQTSVYGNIDDLINNKLPNADELRAMLEGVNVADVISAASHDPDNLSTHMRIMKQVQGDGMAKLDNTQKELIKNIISNIYRSDAGDGQKDLFVSDLIKDYMNDNVKDEAKEISKELRDAALKKREEREEKEKKEKEKKEKENLSGKDYISRAFSKLSGKENQPEKVDNEEGPKNVDNEEGPKNVDNEEGPKNVDAKEAAAKKAESLSAKIIAGDKNKKRFITTVRDMIQDDETDANIKDSLVKFIDDFDYAKINDMNLKRIHKELGESLTREVNQIIGASIVKIKGTKGNLDM